MRLNTNSEKTQLLWSALLAAVLSLACGCANTRPVHVWTDAALEAESKQIRGELDEADARYVELLESAPDTDRRRWLVFNRAEIAREQGRTDDARGLFEELTDADIQDLWGANAAWQLAEMRPDGPRKVEAMVEVITRYPAEVAAERALEWLARSAKSRGTLDEFVTLSRKLHDETAGALIADNILRRRAIAQESLGRLDDALDTYRKLHRLYSDESLADDALWESARIYRDVQNWEAALPLLERLATDVESSWFVGSYASEWVDDSILLLAEIHLLFLDDYDTAIEWYDYYVEEYPYGFKADDAAWGAVEAKRLGGDEAGHFSAMRRFLRDYPESEWARVARARLGVGGTDDSD